MKINKKTAIQFSTKFVFCLRVENTNKSQRAIYRDMKAQGYNVGKGDNISDWAKKGSAFWFNLIRSKGDGAKYVIFSN